MDRIVDTQEYLDMVCDLLAQGHTGVPVPVKGVSMRPFLRDGDRVLLDRVTDPIAKGDILLFCRPGGQYVLHRVVRIPDDTALWMLGDSQLVAERIPREAVRARAVCALIRGKKVAPGTLRWWFYAHPWRLLAPWRRQIGRLRECFRR